MRALTFSLILVSLIGPLPARAQEEIKVGEFASLTGGNATFGISSHNGAVLAIEQINAAGGVLGKKITLLTEDDQSKSGEPATIVRKLISSDKVVALLGEIASSRSLEAGPIAQQSHIPMISPGSTNPKVTEVGDYIFRICFIDPFQGTVMSKFAISRGWKKAAILTDVKQDYSVGLAQFFKEHFTANGGQIVKEQSYSTGDKDFKAQLTSMKANKPDVVFLPGYYTEVGLIARQARQLGIKVPLLGGDGWDSDVLVKVGGEAMEGNFFSNHFSTEDQAPVIQDFLKKYAQRWGGTPDAMAALGYDAAEILVDAIKRANTTDAQPLRDAIAATKDFNGVTGKITLDEKRNATKSAVVLTIKGGKFSYVETIAP
jgi:branched-chain amino acid transport system substrate-binding protein